MTKIKEVIKIRNKKLRYNIIFLLIVVFGFSCGYLNFSKVSQGTESLTIPKVSDVEITILTPTNTTYSEPDSGYYPGTYGFDNDVPGSEPEGWSVRQPDGLGFIEVDAIHAGHRNVLEIRKNGGSDKASTSVTFAYNGTSGTFEFWLYKDTDSGIDPTRMGFYGVDGSLQFGIQSGDLYRGPFGGPTIASNAFSINTWHHMRVDFNLAVGWQIQIDDTWYGSGYSLPFEGTPTQLDSFGISSIFSGDHPNYGAWIDALDYSWHDEYSIGDNLDEGLLVSYDNTTTLEWQGYSLDGQPNKTIYGDRTIPMPFDGLHYVQVFGNNTSGTFYESNVRYFTVDRSHSISIQTPEAKTYIASDSGYYPGIFGFEDASDGILPLYMISDEDYPVSVYSSRTGHNKVLWFDDNGYSYRAGCHNLFDQNITSGTIEYWFLVDDAYDRTGVQARQGTTSLVNMGSRYDLWRYDDGVTVDLVIQQAIGGNMPGPYDNTWHHIRIAFECTTGNYMGLSQYTWKCWIDGIESADMDFYADSLFADNFRMSTSSAHTSYNMYIDAIGYSWLPDYDIGDNLNEGLLLSYDSSVTLDWQAYSLDGASNRTILGYTTIPMPSDGQHYIQVFGNDSIGNMYESDIRYFDVDVFPIDISIISPTPYTLYQTSAPSFEIYIDDSDLNATWYSLDDGVTDIPFTGFTGTIDQMEWNKASNGTVIIGFYANNSVNNISYESVTVRKDVLGPIITVNSPQTNEVCGFNAPYYDLSIVEFNLDSIWYSFDYGVTIFPLYSLTGTLDQAIWETKGGGTVPIRFYANDSLGHESFKDVSVIKDLINPLVSINSPDSQEIFGNIPPIYDISITESNLETYWYTLDGGTTNITIYSLTGSILQSEWDKYGNGTLTMRFYAEDGGGNKGLAEVIVRKDINLPLITIISPQLNQILGFQAPQFQLSVLEPNMDAMWYTLDGGITTFSFTEFTGQIDATEWAKFGHGAASIRFYVRDKAGNEAFAEVQVNKDLIAPIITINAPQFGTVFTDFSPLYSISIEETNLASYWYSLDGGTTNNTITALSGAISESAWNALPNGHVTLTLYARDEGGNIGQNSVLITKNSTEEPAPPPVIPGYDLYLLIGMISVISTLIIRKRLKS